MQNKYSQTRMFLEYIGFAFAAYLLLSLAITIIGGFNYRTVLTHEAQIAACIFIYSWIPTFRIDDMIRENKLSNPPKY